MIGDYLGNAGAGGPGTPSPIQPARKSSRFLIGCLIGSGLVVALILAAVVFAWMLFGKTVNLGSSLVAFIKTEYTGDLTPDHTPEQRAEFDRTYDAMVRDMKQNGWWTYLDQHEASDDLLDEVDADGKITVEESRRWIDQWNRESSPEPGGTAP